MPQWKTPFIGCALLLLTADSGAQVGGYREPTPLTTKIVSPAVIATWGSGFAESASPRLHFLVLWRGTPGWVTSGGFGARGEFLGGSGDNSIPPHTMSQRISVGDIAFALSIDVPNNVARIGGEEISLDTTNVILVDHVDSAEGPQIARRMWVTPGMPASDRFEFVIRREPELRKYLRCDFEFQNASEQERARILCGYILPQQ